MITRRRLFFIIAIIILFIVIFTAGGYYAIHLCPIEIRELVSKELNRNFGDFFSGTLGTCLAFVSVILMFLTFDYQREQFKKTMDDTKRTRFEGTFFNMMSMFYNVRNETNIQIYHSKNVSISNLQDYYNEFKSSYQKKINEDDDFNLSVNSFKNEDSSFSEDTAKHDIGDVFYNFSETEKVDIGFYFRYLHNIISFVISSWEGKDTEIRIYLSFIQAQMSNEELGLLFYDSISDKGLDKNYIDTFKQNLDKYSFLENISAETLLDRSHHKIFPLTVFAFLNSDEKEIVRKKRMKMGNCLI